MQRVVSGLGRLSDATGALAIDVDHVGKNQDAGLSERDFCGETGEAAGSTMPAPDRPRSSSITTICSAGQPSMDAIGSTTTF